MGKYDVDFDDYEEKEGGYDGPVPKRGTYPAVLVSCKEHTSSDTAIEWIFEITEGDYKGWRGWLYSDMENAKWKTQQIVKALQGGDEKKMTIDPVENSGDGTKSKTVKKANPVKIRTRIEKYEEEDRAKIRTVMPDSDGAAKKADKKKKKKGDDPF